MSAGLFLSKAWFGHFFFKFFWRQRQIQRNNPAAIHNPKFSMYVYFCVRRLCKNLCKRSSLRHISFVESCHTWIYFSSSQVFKKILCVFSQKQSLIAFAALIRCQENWCYGKVPLLHTSQIQLPPFPSSESNNAIFREGPKPTAVMQKPHYTFRSWRTVLPWIFYSQFL